MKYIAIVLTSSFLAACGGGGGGGTSSAPAAAPTATAALSSANQSVAAQDTTSSAFLPLLSAQSVTGVQASDESVLFGFARDQMDKLQVYASEAKSGATLVGVTQSGSTSCSNGGSLSYSVTVANPNGTVAAGDGASITSNGCNQGYGVLSGTLGFVINSLTGSYGSTSYSAGLTMTFANLSIISSQISASINGSLSYSLSVNGSNSRTATLSTPSLSVAATYGGVSRSRTLTNYGATLTRTPDASAGFLSTYFVNGYLTSSSLSSQAVAFNTLTPIVIRGYDSYPTSGVLLITGANNSKLKVTALSNILVKEELDANGDNIYESSSTVNWNTLM